MYGLVQQSWVSIKGDGEEVAAADVHFNFRPSELAYLLISLLKQFNFNATFLQSTTKWKEPTPSHLLPDIVGWLQYYQFYP